MAFPSPRWGCDMGVQQADRCRPSRHAAGWGSPCRRVLPEALPAPSLDKVSGSERQLTGVVRNSTVASASVEATLAENAHEAGHERR